MEHLFKIKYEVKYNCNNAIKDNSNLVKKIEEYIVNGVDDFDVVLGSLLRYAKTEIGYNDWNKEVSITSKSNRIVLKNKRTKKKITITHQSLS